MPLSTEINQSIHSIYNEMFSVFLNTGFRDMTLERCVTIGRE